MGKEPVMPKTLLLKMVEAPLRITMQMMVMVKKLWVQEEVSTFTSTVITIKMASMTVSEASTRTRIGTLRQGYRKRLETPRPQASQAGWGLVTILKESRCAQWLRPCTLHSGGLGLNPAFLAHRLCGLG